MPIKARVGNVVHTFPDGTTDDEIRSALEQEHPAVASPPADSIWNRFSRTVTTNSPLNPMNWPGMVKSAFESPFSEQNMQGAQHAADVFTGKVPPEPFTRGDIGEGLGHLANGVAMYGLGNEIGAEPPLSMPSFTNLPQQVMAGVRAGAPGVMQGGGKLVAGAAVAKVLPHEAQIALGYPMYQGAKQVGEGLSKGYKAFKSAGIEPPPTFGPTASSTSGNARFVPGQYDAPKIQRPPVETGGGHVPDYVHPGPSPEEILQKIAADKKAKLNAAPTAPAPAAKPTTPTVAPPPAPMASTAEQSLPGGRAVAGPPDVTPASAPSGAMRHTSRITDINRQLYKHAHDLDLPGSPAGQRGSEYVGQQARRIFGAGTSKLTEDQLYRLNEHLATHKTLDSMEAEASVPGDSVEQQLRDSVEAVNAAKAARNARLDVGNK